MIRCQLNLFLKAACQRKLPIVPVNTFRTGRPLALSPPRWLIILLIVPGQSDFPSCIPNPDKSTMTSSIRKPMMIILLPEAFRLSPYRMMRIPITTRVPVPTFAKGFGQRASILQATPHPIRIQLSRSPFACLLTSKVPKP